ncbi:hypothetical protein ONZ43_g7544 [Nemania bipapillata]|uniref:Uncharacterized protein n=1 Tax=Nemania bipapillata TaxID=110536 RepID=A0ACC2HQL3_9PEZI|nr:hypothetical protein ONZ43_g7544 [Nemania bipapillata]
MAKVAISDAPASGPIPGDAWFPRRPAFGTNGNPVTLWANYFKLEVLAATSLLKYSLDVKRIDKVLQPDEQGNTPKPKKGAKKGGKKDDKTQSPKGRKLHSIIKSALADVAKSVPYATEFKDQVVSMKPFTLPTDSVVRVRYRDEGKDDEYEVKFNGPNTVDLSGLMSYLNRMDDLPGDTSFPKFADVIDVISIITGHYARNNPDASALGRSRYFPLDAPQSERQDLGAPEFNRIIRGYFQSARPATGRLLLNANVAHGVFRPKGFVSDLIAQSFKTDNQSLHKAISRLRCRCKILSDDKDPKKTRFIQKIISGLALPGDGGGQEKPKVKYPGAGPKDVQFHLRSPAPSGLKANTYCTVLEYYQKRYGHNINPNYPVVNVGTKIKPVYMPAEFVEILDGQPVRRKTTPNETRSMISFSCRSPFANATSISDYGRTVLGLDNSKYLSQFGITIDKTLLTVQGRELMPPTIVYKDKQQKAKSIMVYQGGWNMENVRVSRPGTKIERWFWISIDRPNGGHWGHDQVSQNMENWVDFLIGQGIAIQKTPLRCNSKVTVQNSVANAVRTVFREMAAQRPQFVFVVLPGAKTDTTIYNDVKKLGDTEFGYRTQHILKSNLMKNNLQIYANLGLKVNLKMGGVNHTLSKDVTIVKQHSAMVVGYDVTHPTNVSGSSEGMPSLVGMVASIDSDLAQWPGTTWIQEGRKEMLGKELEIRFADRLRLYQKHNKKLPKNIIIFRDGVSEGQFETVLKEELPYIRAACQRLYPATDNPKISIIVSVKRHQTRFYPTNPDNMVSSRNVKNGTVVDRGVTQAVTWDFFLTAHSGLQGTSRPAHYTVLLDEVFRTLSRTQAANELEKLTFEMCHLFGRATKAVSICPPAYYADILCTRARVYLSDIFESSDQASTVSSSTTKRDIPAINLHENLKDSMFYI